MRSGTSASTAIYVKGCADAGLPGSTIIELANGCILLTVADDFAPALDGVDRP